MFVFLFGVETVLSSRGRSSVPVTKHGNVFQAQNLQIYICCSFGLDYDCKDDDEHPVPCDKGYCAISPWMKRICPDTCGFCVYGKNV